MLDSRAATVLSGYSNHFQITFKPSSISSNKMSYYVVNQCYSNCGPLLGGLITRPQIDTRDFYLVYSYNIWIWCRPTLTNSSDVAQEWNYKLANSFNGINGPVQTASASLCNETFYLNPIECNVFEIKFIYKGLRCFSARSYRSAIQEWLWSTLVDHIHRWSMAMLSAHSAITSPPTERRWGFYHDLCCFQWHH